MTLKIREEPGTALAAYAQIPIAFEVTRLLDVAAREAGKWVLTERPADRPYVKNYDALDGGPMRWQGRFDIAKWAILAAYKGERRVGGAAVAYGAEAAAGRDDVAVLWDLRLAPDFRRRGAGSALFRAAATSAAARGFRTLRAETQNVNVAACAFYARQGCILASVRHHAYPDLPNEVQMLWHKDL